MRSSFINGGLVASVKRTYLSKNGRDYFHFEFKPSGGKVEIFCRRHPPLNGRDDDPHKTHLFASGKICLVHGHEPRTQGRAEQLAAQWAEYYLDYRRTGKVQN